MSFYNDGIHDTWMNLSAEAVVVIYGLIVNVVVKMPDTAMDKNYQRVYLRTSVNIEKFKKGNRGNFLIAIFMEQMLCAIDFELKFLLPIVSLNAPRT